MHLPSIKLNRLQRLLGAVTGAAFLLTLAGLNSQHWWYLAVPLLVGSSFYAVSRTVVTRKRSLWWLKTSRPLIVALGLMLLLTSGTGSSVYNLWVTVAMAAVVALTLGGLLRYELLPEPSQRAEHIISLLALFLIVNAAAQAQAVWNVPLAIVLLASWFLLYVIGNFWLSTVLDRPETVALVWALLGSELIAIASFWLIFYSLPKLNVIFSQTALIVTALGYSFGGIYYHHRERNLTRNLLFEYIAVAGLVFLVLVVLSRWTNAV